MSTEPIRILLVDDHPVVRDGLRALIDTQPDLDVIAEAANAPEALARIRAGQPDLVITDLQMRGGDGVTLIRAVRRHHPHIPILVLTAYGSSTDVSPALEAGATSYLLKDSPRSELFTAIRATSHGDSILSPAVASVLIQHFRTIGEPEPDRLSGRELDILTLVAEGRTNAEIGRHLHISEATVKTHLVRLYNKLEVPDRASAVASAYQRGYLPRMTE